jgi:hypothetical protein
MMNLGTEKSEKQGSQQVTCHKTGEQQLLREGLCLFEYRGQKAFHEGFLRIMDPF